MSLFDASRLNTPRLVYMIEDMLPECGAGFFWGPSGSGKTFTILDAALSIANARPFLGHATLPGTVAYMCGEGQAGLGIRVKARLLRQEQDDTKVIAEIARTQGDEAARSYIATLRPYTSDNLKIRDQSFPMHFTGGRPNEDLTQVMEDLRTLNSPPPGASEEAIRDWPYLRLVILDALENFAGDLSVSHRSSANRIVNTMQWMAGELQCCVLAVAHPVTGPGGEMKMVGSDRFKAAADFMIRYAPDDVAAPGALDSATISSEKSKDDVKFKPFGVELHPCEWDEPKVDDNWEPIPYTDENGQPATDPETGMPWVTEKVTSQTVRLIERDTSSGAKPPAAQAMPSPVLRDNRPVSRIRPILRPEPRSTVHPVPAPVLHAVPTSTAVRKEAAPAPAETQATQPARFPVGGPATAALASTAARLRYFARKILEQSCPACLRPAGESCRGQQGTLLLGQSLTGEMRAHDDRILAAAMTSPDPEEFLAKILEVLTPVPAVPARPAATASDRSEPAPAPAADPLAGRLSWTTVRPDSPPPSLEQIFAGA